MEKVLSVMVVIMIALGTFTGVRVQAQNNLEEKEARIHTIETALFELGFGPHMDVPDGKEDVKTLRALEEWRGSGELHGIEALTKEDIQKLLSRAYADHFRL